MIRSLLCIMAVLSTAWPVLSATLQEAGALMQKQDYAAAEAMLREIAGAEPDNARAAMMLASAVHSQERWAEAAALHERACAFDANLPNAKYNWACAEARRGHADRAFELLQEVHSTKKMNLTGVELDPDLASLLDDPRLKNLLPTEAELADPFVEPTQTLHHWAGEARNDQYGWIARRLEDADGDGVADVVTSAPTWGENNQGKVYAYSGATGALLWTAEGESGDQLGLGVESAGDVNADGRCDVVAGAPGGDRALVYSGADGAVLLELEAEETGEFFGRKVSDLGDVDGDGHDDILIGAPQNDHAAENAGATYIYSGRDGSLLWSFYGENANAALGNSGAGAVVDGQIYYVVGAPGAGNGGRGYVFKALSEEPAFIIDSGPNSVRLGGMFASVVGDVDADGVQDIYLSDWADRTKGPQTGRVVVHSGRTGEQLLELVGEAAGDGFGIGPADAGDLDGDGHDDLVVGAWQHGGAAPSGGKVYLYSGRDGHEFGAITCKVPGETFGFDATGMGDLDGDGRIDLLLTSAWSAIHGSRSGRMFVVSSGIERAR